MRVGVPLEVSMGNAKPIVMDPDLFASDEDKQRSERAIGTLLKALTLINIDYIDTYPETPPLYASGVVYREETGVEHWDAIPALVEVGRGDCEDLACWLAADISTHRGYAAFRAQLESQGYQPANCDGVALYAWPELTGRTVNGHHYYHVQVRCCNGQLLDPSADLGMPREAVG